ncbi:hypothetical protein A3Q56_06885 [Intoshia linei]|uniref:Uncharacterized protein n=1 Tax=Intoshia linei TaxID=1819745 RepID=A0A177AVF1_9BILA|nr:hypothetical protein A3Q56_06885 [Intoshia linei]
MNEEVNDYAEKCTTAQIMENSWVSDEIRAQQKILSNLLIEEAKQVSSIVPSYKNPDPVKTEIVYEVLRNSKDQKPTCCLRVSIPIGVERIVGKPVINGHEFCISTYHGKGITVDTTVMFPRNADTNQLILRRLRKISGDNFLIITVPMSQ